MPRYISSTLASLCLEGLLPLFHQANSHVAFKINIGFLLPECLSHLECGALPREEKVQPLNPIRVLFTLPLT